MNASNMSAEKTIQLTLMTDLQITTMEVVNLKVVMVKIANLEANHQTISLKMGTIWTAKTIRLY